MRMLAWELVGAVVGAGLASGREIAAFFARYGRWSYPGIIMAVGMLVWLASAEMPINWRGRWPEYLWRSLLTLMMIATGGAMTSAAGEVAALVTPVRGAYGLGMLLTLLLAWFLACRSHTGLAMASRILLALLAVLLCLGFTLPPMKGVPVDRNDGVEVLLRAVAYGGFNAALQWPLATAAGSQYKRRSLIASGLIVFMMLFMGNGLLLRHSAFLGEPMPFLKMMQPLGKVGYALCAASLYLAVLSTLTACIRAERGRIFPLMAMATVSLLGFGGIVDAIYPALGICCMLLLLVAKIMNSAEGPFLSRKDML